MSEPNQNTPEAMTTEDAPLRIDVEHNDFVPEDPVRMYQISMHEDDLLTTANALAENVAGAWIFDPKGTINDDVQASYGIVRLLKKFNAFLPADKRLGCVSEELLPFEGGDIYINAMYRLNTKLMGSVITAAVFSYDRDLIAFRLFDPVRYPNAKRLSDCLGDRVPLSDIESLEEVKSLTREEMDAFCQAIRNAWCSHY